MGSAWIDPSFCLPPTDARLQTTVRSGLRAGAHPLLLLWQLHHSAQQARRHRKIVQLTPQPAPPIDRSIIRADARGSLEAIEKELGKLDHPEVEVRILQKSVGGISVADVTLASASQAVILGFNVIPDEAARALADERNVEIRRYDIIYKLAEDIRAILEGRLRPEQKVVELGRALVKAVFNISRVGAVAGCYVAQGTIDPFMGSIVSFFITWQDAHQGAPTRTKSGFFSFSARAHAASYSSEASLVAPVIAINRAIAT